MTAVWLRPVPLRRVLDVALALAIAGALAAFGFFIVYADAPDENLLAEAAPRIARQHEPTRETPSAREPIVVVRRAASPSPAGPPSTSPPFPSPVVRGAPARSAAMPTLDDTLRSDALATRH